MAAAVYTIPFDQPFLDTLVAGLMARAGRDPLALTAMTVLLPTRRAMRNLREAFLRASGGKVLLLPRMVPVGDLDPEALGLLADEVDGGGDDFELPPAIPELRRRLVLTRLVQKFGARQGPPMALGQAAALAAELGRFIDEVQSEGCDFARLADLAPAQYAAHWRDILDFLAIVTEHWPALLAEIGCLDPVDRRNRLLAARAAAWRANPPRQPVIATGITGGIPAVGALLEVVASLPQGAVVLPGLDTTLDGASWEEIRLDPTHPQHLMIGLLDRLEVEARLVPHWAKERPPPARARLVSEALAPASLSHRWRFIRTIDGAALSGLRRLDCGTPQEEGLAIALLLRERLERPGETAALITPDRALGRRVAAELRRWHVDIDDSAGVPLNNTPPGVFLRLVLDFAAQGWAPLPLLAALKHPFAACGLAPAMFRELVRQIEIAALRGPRPESGPGGLRAVIERPGGDLDRLVTRLDKAIAPLVQVLAEPRIGLDRLVAAHIAAAEALAERDDAPGAATLWREAAGEAAALFVDELLQNAGTFRDIPGRDYPALFEALLAGPVVRPAYGRHPRLFIWGLLEARLQHADLVILGGLNEGVWPAISEGDPWLSRPMRQELGLPPKERRIGAAALDFVLGLGAREVVMTRATRVDGTPTVPSRWLLRLDTVLEAVGLGGKLAADARPREWQRLIDAPTRIAPAEPPEPRPPLIARPRQLSVTEVETWLRDPYAIYAKRILRLKALSPLDEDPGLADRGIIIHDALANFLRAYPKQLPPDAAALLASLGETSFGAALSRPGVWAFWWPRFLRIAHWVAAEEAQRRPLLDEIFAERDGRIVLARPAGNFTLTCRADRIERRRDGAIALIDYKTGSLPTGSDIAQGFAPQLPLEAAIIEQGGFGEMLKGQLEEIAYWRLSGGNPAGEVKSLASDPAKLRALIADTLEGLRQRVIQFDDPDTPYPAVPQPDKAPRYSDYTHLERVKEWQTSGEEEE